LEKTEIRGFFNFQKRKEKKRKPSNLRFLSKSKNRNQRWLPKSKNRPTLDWGFQGKRTKKGKKKNKKTRVQLPKPNISRPFLQSGCSQSSGHKNTGRLKLLFLRLCAPLPSNQGMSENPDLGL
jgi:hypothetical protein